MAVVDSPARSNELNDELWLLTHPDIRKSGRIYAFMAHCVEAIRKRRDLIEGLWLLTTEASPRVSVMPHMIFDHRSTTFIVPL